jgi:ribosome-associated protein
VSDDVRVGRVTIPAAELTWRYDTPGGPGGQHANRAATRVELSFDVAGSPSLGDTDRNRLVAALGPTVVVTAADSRSQARNRELAVERLRTLVGEALKPERPRRKTKPSRAAKTRRLDAKRQRGDLKRSRGRVRPDD